MKHTKFLLILAAFCCMGVQCKKESEEDKLPPETMVGLQTGGCLMGGIACPQEKVGYTLDGSA